MATTIFAPAHAVRENRLCGTYSRIVAAVVCALIIIWSSIATAQDTGNDGNFVKDVAKQVLLDPTTYAPAAVLYTSMQLDWNTSQPLFQAGFVEKNARYTQSGLAGDRPLSYSAGNRQLLVDSLAMVPSSMANNALNRMIERGLTSRYPEKKTLWKTLGWVERIAFASYTSYLFSRPHFEQWRTNVRMAEQLPR